MARMQTKAMKRAAGVERRRRQAVRAAKRGQTVPREYVAAMGDVR